MSAPSPRKTSLATLWLLLLIWTLAAPAPSCIEAQDSSRYRIGPRDVIRVKVEEAPDLPPEHTVSEDGYISFDPIGRIEAKGLTEAELQKGIRQQLEKQGMRRATVTVEVTAFRSRPVLVLGAVMNPGNQTSGSSRLMEVLLAAGGLSPEHGPTVQVRRQAENGLSDQVTVLVSDLFDKLDPDMNLPILAGDVINVATARILTVHVLGAVNNVGSLTFKNTERVSVLAAIARAGGLADTASRKIAIKRKDPKSDRLEEVLVDFRRILDGKDPDVELQDGDVLVAKESFF